MAKMTKIEKSDIRDLLKHLNDICMLITSFSETSEKSFLEIGGKLQLYLKNSAQVSEQAVLITETITGEILNKGISELETMLEEIGSFLSEEAGLIKNNRDELLETHSKLECIEDELSGFERIVKRFRMLGISTKIESTRLNLEDTGFFALAESVDKLSGIISDKIGIIKKKAGFLINELKKTASDLDGLELKQQEQSKQVLNKTTRSLLQFKSKNKEISAKASIVSDLASNVLSSISGIVSAIQFHDITRQQLEHTQQALVDIQAKIMAEDEEGQNSEFWGMVYDLLGLEAIQLENTKSEFVSAVEEIISHLTNVENGVSAILKESYALAGIEGGQASLRNFESDLGFISKGLMNNIEISDELAEAIKSIVSIVDDLSKQVIEIEEVGSEIEIIALNARVKAAHFGSNGSALGIISESIQGLSLEAKTQTGSTMSLLEGVLEDTGKLKDNIASENRGKTGGILNSVASINTLLAALLSSEKATAENVKSMENKVNLLLGDIHKCRTGITIHNKADETLGKMMYLLGGISEQLRIHLDIKSDRDANTKNIYRKYTMSSERKVHEQYTGKKLISKAPEKPVSDYDSGLGDNVELF